MSVLHWLAQFFSDVLGTIPLPVVRWVFVLVPILLIGWVLQLPAATVYPADRQRNWWQNLKVWAWLTLVIQVLLYSAF